jgi:hypothetical protein
MTATKRFRVAVHVMTKHRDFASRCILAKLLEEQGCDVFLTSGHNYIPVLKYWRPHAFIHTTGNKMRFAAEACPSTRLFLYVGEGDEGKHTASETTAIADDFVRERLDRIYIWGEKTRERLRNDLEAQKRAELTPLIDSDRGWVKVAGYPRGDVSKLISPLPVKSRSTVGIATHLSKLSPFNGAPTLRWAFGVEKKVDDIEAELRELRTLNKIIDHLIANTSLNVSVRPYPLESRDGYMTPDRKGGFHFVNPAYRGRVEVDTSLDFTSWAKRQRLIISGQTTAITDVLLLGVPFVNIDILSGNRNRQSSYSSVHELFTHVGYSPKTYEELFEALEAPEKMEMHSERFKEFWEQEYALNDSSGSALDFVSQDIVQCLNQNAPSHAQLLPRMILERADDYLFRKIRRENPTECNFHYKKGVDLTPPEYDEIVRRILANRSEKRQRPLSG